MRPPVAQLSRDASGRPRARQFRPAREKALTSPRIPERPVARRDEP